MSELLPPVGDDVAPLVDDPPSILRRSSDDPRTIGSAVGYSGRTAVLATKHGNLGLIGPAMHGALGTEVVSAGVDTGQRGILRRDPANGCRRPKHEHGSWR